MRRLIIVMLAGALAFTACGGTNQTEQIVVASERADCTGEGPKNCLLIKREGSEGWQLWHSGIEGFEYTPGNEYVLEIRKERDVNPSEDQPIIKYILVKQVSKTHKTSEGMSAGVRTEQQEEDEQLEREMEVIE